MSSDDAQIEALFAEIVRVHGGLDFWCTARRMRSGRIFRAVPETSREGFRVALDVSAYSLVALARRAAPLMEARGGGSILTLPTSAVSASSRTTT